MIGFSEGWHYDAPSQCVNQVHAVVRCDLRFQQIFKEHSIDCGYGRLHAKPGFNFFDLSNFIQGCDEDEDVEEEMDVCIVPSVNSYSLYPTYKYW